MDFNQSVYVKKSENTPYLNYPVYVLLTLFILFLMHSPAQAAPPIWETSFGAVIASLTGQDDDQTDVTLSFQFPYAGSNYTTVWVGTNGCLQLDTLGTDSDIDYDMWEYFEEFINDNDPIICPLNTDLDLTTTGTIHFNDFGNRAVFTWNEVGTNENETALNSFQVQLYSDGTIVLGFNGILDDPSEDLINDLDEGIVTGVTISDNVDPNPSNLSNTPFSTSIPTVYERWCYVTVDNCGVGGINGLLSGPTNASFDLDQTNVVFIPNASNGFDVSSTLAPPSVGPAAVIPTMTEWGMIIFMVLAGLGAIYYLRKQRMSA
jgi:hypothetical protein